MPSFNIFSCNFLLLLMCFLCLGHGFVKVPNSIHRRQASHHAVSRLYMGTAGFNPFTTRNRNERIYWYELEMQHFYDFVEAQPLLNANQELQYGKAMKIWQSIELFRSNLQRKRMVKCRRQLADEHNMTLPGLKSMNLKVEEQQYAVTYEQLSNYLECSIETLKKIEKYAKVSKDRLITSNLKLVLAVVSRYRTEGVPNSELISEGILGLAKAAARYDYTKGFRFATYATWYIHQAIADHVKARKHPAKMPSKYIVLLRRVRKYVAEQQELTGVNPSSADIASALKETRKDVDKVLSMNIYPALLGQAMMKGSSHKSDTSSRTYGEFLTNQNKNPAYEMEAQDVRSNFERMLDNLNEVERDVLRLRLGLDDGRVKPIKEVGSRFNISWKQVRNVEKSAMDKLQHCPEMQEVMDYYSQAHFALPA